MRKMVELMDEQSAEQEEVMSSIRSASGRKSARASYSTATTASVASGRGPDAGAEAAAA